MIKLQELLELREMVYTNEIPKKHKKRFTRKTPHFGDFPITYKDFPENDSKVTLNEIKLLSKIEPSPMLVKEYDEVEDTFKKALEVTDFNADTKYIDDIVHESVKYIMELKYKYNRPRPYQIAAFYGIDLNGTELDSMKTPSYPSGHAVQGYLVADILSQFSVPFIILQFSSFLSISFFFIYLLFPFITNFLFCFKSKNLVEFLSPFIIDGNLLLS